MKIGYARVSTDDQTLDLQLDALTEAGCETLYQEHASGKKNVARPELENCLKAIREGDTLVVWRLDRLGRSLSDLVAIVGGLEKGNVGFESLTERIETTTPTGKLVFHLFASLAEFERNLIRERTKAGIAAARKRGKSTGRPKKLGPKEIEMMRTLLAAREMQVKDIAKQFGISPASIYRYIPISEVPPKPDTDTDATPN